MYIVGVLVITRGERRRRWSAEEKQAIVAESLKPGVSIAGVARKHGICTGQLYGWRHQFVTTRRSKAASFARVELLNEPCRLIGPAEARSGLIEIVLPRGATVRMDAQVDEQALRCADELPGQFLGRHPEAQTSQLSGVYPALDDLAVDQDTIAVEDDQTGSLLA